MVKAKDLLDYYLVEFEVKRFVRELNLSKRLATIAQGDVTLSIWMNGGGVCCLKTTDEPLILSSEFTKPRRFKHLHSVSLGGGDRVDRLSLSFSGSGWLPRNGPLLLQSKSGRRYAIHIPSSKPFFFPQKIS